MYKIKAWRYQSPTGSLTSQAAIGTKQVQNLLCNCIHFGPKFDVFFVGQELDLNIGFPFNVSFQIGGPVHIVCFDGLAEVLKGKFG